MGKVADSIEAKLQAGFKPVELAVIDESHKHHGHAGWREGGETHFRIEMVSAALHGKSRVERQRAVYEALKNEMNGPVHALALSVRAPGEH